MAIAHDRRQPLGHGQFAQIGREHNTSALVSAARLLERDADGRVYDALVALSLTSVEQSLHAAVDAVRG